MSRRRAVSRLRRRRLRTAATGVLQPRPLAASRRRPRLPLLQSTATRLLISLRPVTREVLRSGVIIVLALAGLHGPIMRVMSSAVCSKTIDAVGTYAAHETLHMSNCHLVCAKNCRATSSLLFKNSESSSSVARMSLDADSASRTRPCICASASTTCCCCSAAMSALPFLKYLRKHAPHSKSKHSQCEPINKRTFDRCGTAQDDIHGKGKGVAGEGTGGRGAHALPTAS